MEKSHTSFAAKNGRNKRRKASHVMAKYSGPSYSDLPSNILESILLRLSIKRILISKCVCKTWYDVISHPEFAKLHLDQAQVYPLIQTSGYTVLSRMLYLVQPEFEDSELKLDCNHNRSQELINRECGCKVKVKLDTKFRLPLRNLQTIVNDGEPNICLKLNMKDHKYKIVNSCNGLLCLCDPSNNEPMVVCNPITGEFVDLPEDRMVKEYKKHDVSCGIGFSPVTNQYKVIRMSQCRMRDGKGERMVAEIHIIGTKSWKNLGFFPYSALWLRCPTYLNGYICWYYYYNARRSIIFFDTEKECFGSISPPNCECAVWRIGVLEGELCMFSTFLDDHIEIWVMKDCVEGKDWVKVFSIANERWPPGSSFYPIKCLNNGAILMYNSRIRALVYHNPKTLGFRYLEIRGMQSKVKAISYIPSFVSLKDVVSGSNTTVHNVWSRCGELKLHKEGKRVSIVEKNKGLGE